jgi:hypothetical protein
MLSKEKISLILMTIFYRNVYQKITDFFRVPIWIDALANPIQNFV